MYLYGGGIYLARVVGTVRFVTLTLGGGCHWLQCFDSLIRREQFAISRMVSGTNREKLVNNSKDQQKSAKEAAVWVRVRGVLGGRRRAVGGRYPHPPGPALAGWSQGSVTPGGGGLVGIRTSRKKGLGCLGKRRLFCLFYLRRRILIFNPLLVGRNIFMLISVRGGGAVVVGNHHKTSKCTLGQMYETFSSW